MRRWLKVLVFLLGLSPAGYAVWRGLTIGLGANPVEWVTHFTGDWTIRLLVITLAVTPLRKLLRMPELIRYRRMTGLFAFFYGSLHFLTYLWLDKFFDWKDMVKDVGKRPFITAGFVAFVVLAPLAVTSTAGSIRRLGGRRWQLLHRLVYVSAIAGVVHYYWLVKSDVRKPVMYGTFVAVLLAYRIGAKLWSRMRSGRANQPSLRSAAVESAGARR